VQNKRSFKCFPCYNAQGRKVELSSASPS